MNIPQVFDYSFLSESCPRAMYLSERMPKGEMHPNMELGTVGHAVLNEFFRAKKPDMDKALACQAMQDLEAKYANELTNNPAEMLIKVLTKIMRVHLPIQSPQVTAQWWMPLSVDIKGAVEPADGKYILGELPIIVDMSEELGIDNALVGGIPDLPIKHTKSDTYKIVDFKFTGAPLTAYLGERYRLSFQIPLYMYLMRKLTGIDFQEGIIQAIYIGEPKGFKPGDTYQYKPVIRWTQQEEDRLFDWLRNRILEYRWRVENEYWPEICGGLARQRICKLCQYNTVCSAKYGSLTAVARALHLTEGGAHTADQIFKSGVR